MRSILALAALLFLMPQAALAQARALEETCAAGEGPLSLRQTLLVVDGALVAPDGAEGPAPENKAWRRFAAQYFDAASPAILQLMDARERLTIFLANADGSGLTPVFTGCLPLVEAAEAERRDAETTTMERFFGNDWRSAAEKKAEAFSRAATLSLVEGVTRARVGAGPNAAFAAGGLVRSLLRTRAFSIEKGLPRIVLLTDLSLFDIPSAGTEAAHTKGRTDAETSGLDLQRADIHLFDVGASAGEAQGAYLRSFFLAAKGQLETIAGIGGSPTSNKVPVTSAVFQGTIAYPSLGQYPIRMRLARDRNGSVVMSWIEEQSNRVRFTPFQGLLNCEADTKCTFIGDKVFAQVWKETADMEPQCVGWMPFGGLRELAFTLDGDALSGRISDSVCMITGAEEGIAFQLQRVPNAAF